MMNEGHRVEDDTGGYERTTVAGFLQALETVGVLVIFIAVVFGIQQMRRTEIQMKMTEDKIKTMMLILSSAPEAEGAEEGLEAAPEAEGAEEGLEAAPEI